MSFLNYRDQHLHADDVAIDTIAKQFGTPCYILSQSTICNNWHSLDQAFGEQPHLICYAIKANSNLSLLRILAALGSGFDVVSVGEYERAIAAGGAPEKIVFSGVGKQVHEIERVLDHGILCINIESTEELHLVNAIAQRMDKKAPIGIRVNPNIDPKTHPYISTGLNDSKFGIPIEEAESAFLTAQSLENLNIVSIDCHIGSQIQTLEPFIETAKQIKALISRLAGKGIHLKHIDMGGGLGIQYQHDNEDTMPSPSQYIQAICQTLNMPQTPIIIEPGRSIVGNAGALITRVLGFKSTAKKHFAIVDAAMNDLLRPALYQGWHNVLPVEDSQGEQTTYDIVGPVCESADFLARDRSLALAKDALLTICDTGAYVSCMASNYNTRARAPEVLIDQDELILIRPRETLDDMLAGEKQCLQDLL